MQKSPSGEEGVMQDAGIKIFCFGRKRLWFLGLDSFQQDGPDLGFWFFWIGWINGFLLDLDLFLKGIGWFVHTKINERKGSYGSPSLKRVIYSVKKAKTGLRKRPNSLIIRPLVNLLRKTTH